MSIKSLEVKGGAGKQDGGEEGLEQEDGPLSAPRSERQVIWEHSSEPRRISVLPLWWRITHSSRWIAQVLASELSLLAFILLLVMVFSEKWLCLSRSRFYQRWPPSVSTRIYTSAHVMSLGLLRICRSKNCSSSENGRDGFKLWANHPVFGMARITFCLTLGLGFVFTIWLHLPYVPGLQRLPFFSWIGTMMSFCEAEEECVHPHRLELFHRLAGVCPVCHLRGPLSLQPQTLLERDYEQSQRHRAVRQGCLLRAELSE
ncbi:outer dense fiber protein 4 isoform X3 [Hyaena hyaena]|uniref:outer dense fiber protein 4 isoform X3 n=1 Tax=Hyaena hyaena TaxID=95912 RepID=UPI001921D619|nr:outer dense fiber protein 4 isoform X3 [Hyaena hyaena]